MSYHDLHITTPQLGRVSISSLPYRVRVQCSRVGGWEAWAVASEGYPDELLGGEFAGPGRWLRLDVDGVVIINSEPEMEELE